MTDLNTAINAWGAVKRLREVLSRKGVVGAENLKLNQLVEACRAEFREKSEAFQEEMYKLHDMILINDINVCFKEAYYSVMIGKARRGECICGDDCTCEDCDHGNTESNEEVSDNG